ncbi:MAG: hypothetical protein CL677_09845 [Bdellovibrionaceae bacterium]|nr:hypothetical protein [Pseudobdellovibrionaceae bacterium]
MEGRHVNDDEIASYLFENQLSNSYENIEVINMSVSGYSTLQSLLLYKNIGKHFKPDIVLLGFSLEGDLYKNSLELTNEFLGKPFEEAHIRPYLTKINNQWTQQRPDMDQVSAYLQAEAPRHWSEVAMLQTFSDIIQYFQRKRFISRMESNKEAPHSKCGDLPSYDLAWETTQEIIRRLKLETQETGTKLIVFSPPSPIKVSESLVHVESPPKSMTCTDRESLAKLKVTIQNTGIGFIDISDTFINSPSINFKAGPSIQWNREGHLRVADRLAESPVIHNALKGM